MKVDKKSIIYTFLILVIMLIAISNYNKENDIKIIALENICPNLKISYFEFEFNNSYITVVDPFNKIKYIYLSKKDNIKCLNKKVYLKTGAILKTLKDSIDVEEKWQKIHGYMGVFTKNSCYFVGKDGKFFGYEDAKFLDNPPNGIETWCNR